LISKQKIKFIRSLQQKKFRIENGVFIAEGVKIVSEALLSPLVKVNELICTNEAKENLPVKTFSKVNTIEVTKNEFEQLSDLKAPQGAMAIIEIPKNELPPVVELTDLVILLDKIRDPGNLGTIIRLADWFGIKTMICSADTVDCYNPKVVQASMGAIFRVKCFYTELVDYITKAQKETEYKIYSTTLNGENLYTIQLQNKAMLLFGNEANGLSEELIQLADKNIHIPAYSSSETSSESLNVSLAAAIICSEFRRQETVSYSK
jgi:TrmH family RNA methyltransferase